MDADGVPTLFYSSQTAAIHQWPLVTTRHDWSREKRGTPVVVTHVRTRKNQPLTFHERADGLVDAVFVGMVNRSEGGRAVSRPLLRSTLECGKRQTAEPCYFAFADDARSVAGLVQFMAEQRAERQMAHLFCTYADGRKKELAAIEKRCGSECEHPAVRVRRATNKREVHMNVYDDIKASDLQVDAEFRDLIPAITNEEREQLEANIVAHGGARDPLVAWLTADDTYTLLDGHNRFEICTRLGLPFSVAEAQFDTREQAADWIDCNQLGRRNLSAAGRKILIGRVYNRAKKSEHDGGKGKKRSGGQNARQSETTAQRIAREHGVDEKTVRRSAKVQQAAATLGIEQEITSGEIKATEAAIVTAAAELPTSPSAEQVKQAREKVGKKKQSKPTPSANAGDSRRKNGRLAHKITLALIGVRSAVETLSATDSTFRDAALHELQSCIGHLSRVQAAAPAKPQQHQAVDDLRAAVVQRWEKVRLWEKHWGIADMKDVRRLFIEVIREEQKLTDK